MQIVYRELNCVIDEIYQEYLKVFPLHKVDKWVNNVIIADIEQSDIDEDWDTITSICELAKDTNTALVVINLHDVFITRDVPIKPYEIYTGAKEYVMLSKGGRQAVGVIRQLMEKNLYTEIHQEDPTCIVFGQCNPGLVRG